MKMVKIFFLVLLLPTATFADNGSLTVTGTITGNSNLSVSGPITAGNGLTVTGSVGVGTSNPAASAALDINSSTKGFLPPRMSTAQRDAIVSPAAGLLIHNTDTKTYNYYTGTTWATILYGSNDPTSAIDSLLLQPDQYKPANALTLTSPANTDAYFYYYAALDVTNSRSLMFNLKQKFNRADTNYWSGVGLHKAFLSVAGQVTGWKMLLIRPIISWQNPTNDNGTVANASPTVNSVSSTVSYTTYTDSLGIMYYSICNMNGSSGTPYVKLRIKIRAYNGGVGNSATSVLSLVDADTGAGIPLQPDTTW